MVKISLAVDEIILGVTHGTYQLILKEIGGKRRIPIVIGVPEAQSIALAVEQKILKRPNTHDLFFKTLNAFSIDIDEVFIHSLEEGVFYARMVVVSQNDVISIDSRTSDAVALAIRFNAPIFIDERILVLAGIESHAEEADTPGRPSRQDQDFEPPKPKSFQEELELMSLDELENLLQVTISEEDYTKAALIRDEIANRK
jgi:bifunctional DNase/RNase